MKRKLLTLLIISLLGLTLAFPSGASAENAISFLITAQGVADDKVIVNMTVNNAKDLYGYEARFTFDPTHLELVEAKSNLSGFSISPKIEQNEIVIAHTKMGNVDGESGNLIIGTLAFKIKKPGTSTVTWKSIKAVDHNLGHQTYSLDKSVSAGSTNVGTPNSNPGIGNVDNNNLYSVTVSEENLKNAKDGKVVIDIADGTRNVLFPAKAARIIGNNKLELKFKDLSVIIPAEVLKEVQDMVSSDELEDAKISFNCIKASADEKNGLLTNASNKAKAKITAGGDIIEFSLSVLTKKGEERKLTKFNKQIIVKLKISPNAQKELLGIYFISDAGELEYVGGVIEGEYMTAEVGHFSKYAVLEYDKSFADVADSHWAAHAIKVLVAKHVVYGANHTQFLPNANITRAEFAAIVVRALGLKATGKSSFTDVNDKAWYATIVTSAEETGIIKGRSKSLFAPNETITREEMASIIVRAYEYKTGIKAKATAAQNEPFTDAKEISAWARDDVNAAFTLGIISGRGDGRFTPKVLSTRADSSQIIVNLLKNL
ncbi:S-layer homology domain-containing protein [Cohnella abietis]|uniref:SLH domain-containing protein n=1 Tax=Cohnella abietis TaxID=2507935 RepID=A0A3T1D744_9BACL|nr:S-layer homology domain-containing protein [Cohnella abietis]BBI33894.1 hypothetical protein KCTCHS21_32930 [Cohnella abietis]